jgi:hypothetical protein
MTDMDVESLHPTSEITTPRHTHTHAIWRMNSLFLCGLPGLLKPAKEEKTVQEGTEKAGKGKGKGTVFNLL